MPLEVKFYYMLDNHTFRPLTGDTLWDIMQQARALPNSGPQYRDGMLCPPIFLRDGVETRPGNPWDSPLHCHHHSNKSHSAWEVACMRWYKEAAQLPEVKEFFCMKRPSADEAVGALEWVLMTIPDAPLMYLEVIIQIRDYYISQLP